MRPTTESSWGVTATDGLVTATDSYISTCVCLSDFKVLSFDINIIFEFLETDNEILGIKCGEICKGDINPGKSFYNQISLKIFLLKFDKTVNLKIFSNGRSQITGVKNKEQCIEALVLFLTKISDIKGSRKIQIYREPSNENQSGDLSYGNTEGISIRSKILYDKQDYNLYINKKSNRFEPIRIYGIPDGNNYIVIGERKEDEFTLKKNGTLERVLPFNRYFIATMNDVTAKSGLKETSMEHYKKLYDHHGREIGYCKFIYNTKRKNIIIVGNKFVREQDPKQAQNLPEMVQETYTILDKKNRPIGKQILFIRNVVDIPDQLVKDYITYNYNSTETILDTPIPTNIEVSKILSETTRIININCNFTLRLRKSVRDTVFLKGSSPPSEGDLPISIKREMIHKVLLSEYCSKIISKEIVISSDSSSFCDTPKGANSSSVNVSSVSNGYSFTLKGTINSFYNSESKYNASLKVVFTLEYTGKTVPNKGSLLSTILMFRNGKIIITGCKTEMDICIIKQYLIDLFNAHPEFIKKPTSSDTILSNERYYNDTGDADLTIYDLL